MSTTKHATRWRIAGIAFYPLYKLYTYFRYRKRVYPLTCLVNEMAKESDVRTRGILAKKILELLYRDWNNIETAGTFDDAALHYLMHKAPWLAIRWSMKNRIVWIATYQGDIKLGEQWEFIYTPTLGLTDDALRALEFRSRNQAKRMDLLHEENKMVTALLIYFIMLSIRNRH